MYAQRYHSVLQHVLARLAVQKENITQIKKKKKKLYQQCEFFPADFDSLLLAGYCQATDC